MTVLAWIQLVKMLLPIAQRTGRQSCHFLGFSHGIIYLLRRVGHVGDWVLAIDGYTLGILSVLPARIMSEVRPLNAFKRLTLTRNFAAIPPKVSPSLIL